MNIGDRVQSPYNTGTVRKVVDTVTVSVLWDGFNNDIVTEKEGLKIVPVEKPSK